MATLLLILQLFPLILQAVQAIEKAIPIPASGKAKLDLILDILKSAYDAGGDLKQLSWDKLAGIAVVMVGKIVGVLNTLGVFQKVLLFPSA